MAKYWFEVRELTTRTAIVDADSEAEARTKLKRWSEPGGGGDAEDGGPIYLGDMTSERFTFIPIVGR